MKKLTLNLDVLHVESFATGADSEERGTVHGNSLPTIPLCTRYGCVSAYCTPTCPAES